MHPGEAFAGAAERLRAATAAVAGFAPVWEAFLARAAKPVPERVGSARISDATVILEIAPPRASRPLTAVLTLAAGLADEAGDHVGEAGLHCQVVYPTGAVAGELVLSASLFPTTTEAPLDDFRSRAETTPEFAALVAAGAPARVIVSAS